MTYIYKNPTVATASANLRIQLMVALRGLGRICVIQEGQELRSLHLLGYIVSDLQYTHGSDSVAFKEADATYTRLVPMYAAFTDARADAAAANLKVAAANFRAKILEVYGDNYTNIPEGEEDSTIGALSTIVGSIFNTY